MNPKTPAHSVKAAYMRTVLEKHVMNHNYLMLTDLFRLTGWCSLIFLHRRLSHTHLSQVACARFGYETNSFDTIIHQFMRMTTHY